MNRTARSVCDDMYLILDTITWKHKLPELKFQLNQRALLQADETQIEIGFQAIERFDTFTFTNIQNSTKKLYLLNQF